MKNEKRITKESGNGLKEPRYDDGVEIRTLEDAATVEAPSNNEFGKSIPIPIGDSESMVFNDFWHRDILPARPRYECDPEREVVVVTGMAHTPKNVAPKG